MKIIPWLSAASLALVGMAFAQDSNTLTVEGEQFVSETAAPAHMENVSTIYSGWRFRTPETQALQIDDFETRQ